MKETADHLLSVVEHCAPLLRAISPTEARRRPAPGKWSKQEILGHLIDSACNNQQKFVRMLTSNGHVDSVGYAQDAWVASQHYNDADWTELITLWEAYNRHLASVIARADSGRHANTITIEGEGPFRLDFVMRDYVEHLKHHLRVVLPDSSVGACRH